MPQKLDKSKFWPKVLQVVPTDDYKVYAYFNDGSVRLLMIHYMQIDLLQNAGVITREIKYHD